MSFQQIARGACCPQKILSTESETAAKTPSDTTCPGLFYATPAQDGMLSRIRIPGGILDSRQFRAIADIANQCGGGYADVTNRANLQVREIRREIAVEVLTFLQHMRLAAHTAEVDHIRNIMSSPTAGIDPQELIDTRPLVIGWDNYIATHPALSKLPAKFSVSFDGGGAVRVSDRPNDIRFAAVSINGSDCQPSGVYFRIYLNVGERGELPLDTGVLLPPDQCLPVLAALAHVYANCLNLTSSRKPRLREVLNHWGSEWYLQEAQRCLSFPLRRLAAPCQPPTPIAKYEHIGVHPQRQMGLSYIGVVLPVGRLETRQMLGLADLAERYGSGTLRLTPWQNLLISDIPNRSICDVQGAIESLGLHWSASNIRSALVACSGSTGCASSATDTKAHVLALAAYLEQSITLDQPVNIHFSGCEKSCAQHNRSDMALVGVRLEKDKAANEGYHVYVGEGNSNQKFGRELYQSVTFLELPALIERMLRVYKAKRHGDESFGEFTNRHAIAELKQLFDSARLPLRDTRLLMPDFL